jgi:hypothetical protein
MARQIESVTAVEACMRGRLFSAFIVGAGVGAAAMPVLASTCFEVIDRNDVVIFRDTRSPVDLSTAGAPPREEMRSRGEHLIIFDAKTCVVLGKPSRTGDGTLGADEIVAEWRAFGGKSGWGTYSSRLGGPPTPVQPATPTPSPAASTRSGPR